MAKQELEAVEVRAAHRYWRFSSGMSVEEALFHISRDTQVRLEDLVLEQQGTDSDEQREILARNASLLVGFRYHVRSRNEGLPKRRFLAGSAVNPLDNYYVPPTVDDLVLDLKEGKYCVLCGPRQSGKSTMVMAAIRQMSLEPTHVVYLDGFEGAKKDWSSDQMWCFVCDSLHLKSPILFPPVLPGGCRYSGLQFKSLFLKTNLPEQVIVILDEADSLLKLNDECLSEFFSTVRAIRNDKVSYNLKGFMLVGVETVRDLLEGQYSKRVAAAVGRGRVHQPGSTPSPLSPFPHDHVLTPQNFSLEDVKSLLQQAARDRPNLDIDLGEIATSIFEMTAGHKGLTGTCLAYVVDRKVWKLEDWIKRVESYRLGAYIFGQATYNHIMEFVRDQASTLGETNAIIAKYLGAEEHFCDAEEVVHLRDFIANGVLVADEREDGYYVSISSPLLRTALLRGCTICIRDGLVEPPPSTTHLDRKWLLQEAVRTLDGEVMCRSECQRSRLAGPSEYAHQFLFMYRLKAILMHAHPLLGAKVLPEVKEISVPGQRRSEMRLDTLIRDGPSFSKFGFQLLANGGEKEIKNHFQRAVKYRQQHSAHVFVINFCMNSARATAIPLEDCLTLVSVVFKPACSSVVVTFVDSTRAVEERFLPLSNWNSVMSFVDV